VLVDRPHRDGRLAIFKVHVRKLVLADDVDLERMAGATPGFVGADIANLCNEAALIASRKNHEKIRQEDFDDAFERVVGGLEKKGKVLTEPERRRVAYHESGHALVGHFTEGADPVQKISIVPRGKGALGYTLQQPTEDRYLISKSELIGRVRVLLAGRAAEEVVFGDISSGASDDLEKAGQIVRTMQAVYGMSERAPNLSLVEHRPGGYLGTGTGLVEHSEEIARELGEEQLALIADCYASAKATIEEHRAEFDELAETLLVNEKLDNEDIERILGERPDAPPPPADV